MTKRSRSSGRGDHWAWVTCAGGAPVLAWIDRRRMDGWVVPWFPDSSLLGDAALRTYFQEDPERAPTQGQSGRWEYKDDGDEIVELDRVRKRVIVGGVATMLALSDFANAEWCWEVEGIATDEQVRAELAGEKGLPK